LAYEGSRKFDVDSTAVSPRMTLKARIDIWRLPAKF
jgi:hypothetical protein